MKETNDLFSRGIATLIDPDNVFEKKIQAKLRGTYGKEIVIKFGMDPTRPDIHLGHAVILRKLRVFQDIGCKVIFLIGDYTTLIGDPTGKSKTRPEISQAEIEANMKTYLTQAGKILSVDPKVFSWIRNSEWFLDVTDIQPGPDTKVGIDIVMDGKKTTYPVDPNSFIGKAALFDNTRMQKTELGRTAIHTVSFMRILSTLSRITHSRLIDRDMFQERLKNGGELYMHEMMYPVLQGIDSSVIASIYGSCDLEIGGSDQTFNMLVGRDVMKMNTQAEQSVMALDILEGLDGKEKMSKSLDNYVGIDDRPNDMYGKIMSIPDPLISRYFVLATYTPLEEVTKIEKGLADGSLHPKDAKMRLAREIVAIYHGDDASVHAEAAFENTFAKGNIPENVPVVELPVGKTMIDALIEAKCADSRGKARTLIEEGAVIFLEGDLKILDPAYVPAAGTYRVGKMRFFRIK